MTIDQHKMAKSYSPDTSWALLCVVTSVEKVALLLKPGEELALLPVATQLL